MRRIRPVSLRLQRFRSPRVVYSHAKNCLTYCKKHGWTPNQSLLHSKKLFQIGKSADDFNGVTLDVYDRERTICDCFKYRTKLDRETFIKAVNAYAVDENKNLANLSKYAKEMKLYAKVMNVMEVLLNGWYCRVRTCTVEKQSCWERQKLSLNLRIYWTMACLKQRIRLKEK